MGYERIRYEVDGPVATITFARPEVLNAMGTGMPGEIIDALDRVDSDPDIRALIVTGEGRAFCSGADLSRGPTSFQDSRTDGAMRPDGTVDYDHPDVKEGSGLFVERFYGLNKPTIAAINGPCAGLGASLPLTMDIRLASETAHFNFLFNRRGMLPECGSTWFLPRLVGISNALEWCYTGRRVSAGEARETGLVKAVYPADELMPAARALALEIAENSAPVSVTITRHMMWRALGLDTPMQAHKVESWGAWHRSRGADAHEGVASFFEKRPPDFPMCVPGDLPDFLPWWDDSDIWNKRG
ncbi:MAG: enoyl-CoA hydratase/isomerase family protein [Novosphingobium sp.]|nr:enoyl-CoA hydratase/isomerase family protein [Novosphingobium sp.]